MEAIRTLLESPDAIKKWLEGKKPGAMVGKRNDPDACPLARFLSEQGNLSYVFVTTEVAFQTQEDEEEQTLDIPDWAQRFVDLVDAGRSTHNGIRAKTALRFLQTISTPAP